MSGFDRRSFLLSSAAMLGCAGNSREPTSFSQVANAQADAVAPQSKEKSGPRAFTPGLVLHGGAGTIPKDLPPDEIAAYQSALENALRLGQRALESGATALDIVELVVRTLEDDPKFNAGRGAVYTANETHELDAAIMDGITRGCGAVAGIKTVRNPIELARLVMEKTRHVFLIGDGAEQFASVMGVPRVTSDYFDTPSRLEALRKAQAAAAKDTSLAPQLGRAAQDSKVLDDEKKGTVGAVALDKRGNLAAATSTGGLTNKMFGRVGDVPVIGAGTYADNQSCAISCTGTGEEYIRHAIAHEVSGRMRWAGQSLREAANDVVHQLLKPGDGGLIGISHTGEIVMAFNTLGMYRGAADLAGRFEVSIWDNPHTGASPAFDH